METHSLGSNHKRADLAIREIDNHFIDVIVIVSYIHLNRQCPAPSDWTSNQNSEPGTDAGQP